MNKPFIFPAKIAHENQDRVGRKKRLVCRSKDEWSSKKKLAYFFLMLKDYPEKEAK